MPESQLRQYRRLADKIASRFPAGASAAVAVMGSDPWLDMAGISLRLAACLADRGEGEVLAIGHGFATVGLTNAAPVAGLIDVAANRATWSEAIAPSMLDALSLLGPGPAVSPEDAPLAEQWRTAMKELKQRFRYLVLDARLDESFLSDAWLPLLDGVYLAVGLGQTSRDAVQGSVDRVRARGAKLLGCIALD